MNDLKKRIASYIEEYGLLEKRDSVLVALSGGADSVFLLHILLCLAAEYQLSIGVMHLNHMLRAGAKCDADFVRDLCARQNIELHYFEEDIAKRSRREGSTVEEAGRNARYEALRSLKRQYHYSKIATAHHMDDHAETVLMHIIRGSGEQGLSGIAPISQDGLIRPLLCVSKEEILKYLQQHGIAFVTDDTNESGEYLRNRVRQNIMPLLKKENPGISRSLMRLSQNVRASELYMQNQASKVPVHVYNHKARVNISDLTVLDLPILFWVLKNTAAALGAKQDISHGGINSLIKQIASASTSWEMHLSGVVFTRRYETLYAAPQKEKNTEFYQYPVCAPGDYYFSKEGFRIKFDVIKKNEKVSLNPYINSLDYDKISKTLCVRSRAQGDCFYLKGLLGQKSVKKYMIDKKIPVERRSKIPIVCDGEAVACIAGYEVDSRYLLTDKTTAVLQITYQPWV